MGPGHLGPSCARSFADPRSLIYTDEAHGAYVFRAGLHGTVEPTWVVFVFGM